jgi:hemerythrin-like domain-containing protein
MKTLTRQRVAAPDPIAAWHNEHGYFSRLLDLLSKQVEVFRTGRRPSYELMLDIISYLRDYSDRYHHPREDAAFARLAAYRPELEPVLASLAQEHRIIADAGERLASLLDAALDGSMVDRAGIETAAAMYLIYYRAHIACEEERVLGPAGSSLTAEDWKAVKAAVPGRRDPLFGADPDRRYRDLRRMIALEA